MKRTCVNHGTHLASITARVLCPLLLLSCGNFNSFSVFQSLKVSPTTCFFSCFHSPPRCLESPCLSGQHRVLDIKFHPRVVSCHLFCPSLHTVFSNFKKVRSENNKQSFNNVGKRARNRCNAAFRVGRSRVIGTETHHRDRIPVKARFSSLVQTGPGSHPASLPPV